MNSRIAVMVMMLAVLRILCPNALAQSDAPLAIVDGVPLSEADVRATASSELDGLQTRRLRFEATSKAEEHQIIEEALKSMIADRLLQAEAEKRGVSVEELLVAEVEASTPDPTDAEIENLYQINNQRLSTVSREAGLQQVRDFLDERNYDDTLEAFVNRLREEYGIESRFGPYRVGLEIEGHPFQGPQNAPITMVEFSDFECPFCRRSFPVIQQLKAEYGEQIRFVYRQFPLIDIHPRAQKAAEASLCADEQGEFWVMHDALFEEPVELEMASLREKAAELGLDTAQFNACLESAKYGVRVRDDIRAGVRAGVTGTPMVFINGRPLTGAQSFAAYAEIIDEELAENDQTAR